MTQFRYRDEESVSSGLAFLAAGALAGFAAGVLVAHRFGGLSGLVARLRDGVGAAAGLGDDLLNDEYDDEYDDEDFSEFEDVGVGGDAVSRRQTAAEMSGEEEELEQRVLEAFRNDPVLSERPVDIGAISDGIIELTGWINSEEEAEHAVTLARGVPDVDTVVNRLAVRPREELLEDQAGRYADGDPTLTESHWEGQQVGTGRQRQGNSSELDRHSNPRPNLEERWTREDAAIAAAAGDVGSAGNRPVRGKASKAKARAPQESGVPRADHVSETPTAPRAD